MCVLQRKRSVIFEVPGTEFRPLKLETCLMDPTLLWIFLQEDR